MSDNTGFGVGRANRTRKTGGVLDRPRADAGLAGCAHHVAKAISASGSRPACEVDHCWQALAEEGDPAAQQCGWPKGEFGLSWQSVPSVLKDMFAGPDTDGSERVVTTMLGIGMKKLDVDALQRAFDG